MKIVLSRKGFDAAYGGMPSPVLPGVGPVSLPIPSWAGEPARKFQAGGIPLGTLISQLSSGKHGPATNVHFDPDLDSEGRKRSTAWRPAFGQVGAAQSHLANHNVGVGDLFLFFGWFRPAEMHLGQWRFVPGSESFHALFGWLQVGSVIHLPNNVINSVPAWLRDHPHVAFASTFSGMRNTIYVAADHLHLTSHREVAAAGRFRRWTNDLKLSAEGEKRTLWKVPKWLDPRQGRIPLSYHGNPTRWIRKRGELYLQSVSRGQEFVLDCNQYPEAMKWVDTMIKRHSVGF